MIIFFAVLGLCVSVCVDGGDVLAMGHVLPWLHVQQVMDRGCILVY